MTPAQRLEMRAQIARRRREWKRFPNLNAADVHVDFLGRNAGGCFVGAFDPDGHRREALKERKR